MKYLFGRTNNLKDSDIENASVSETVLDEKERIRKKYRRYFISNILVTLLAAIIILGVFFVLFPPTRKLKKSEYKVSCLNYYLPDYLYHSQICLTNHQPVTIYVSSEDDNSDPRTRDSRFVSFSGFYASVEDNYLRDNPYACVVTVTSDHPITYSDITPVIGENGEIIIEVNSVKSPLWGFEKKKLDENKKFYEEKYVFFCEADYIRK
ncbi:MAG: hypothetical protein MJ172_00640 [Clostridia bacterium]|nr:hypothetical protein [Clostridia bacterium]